MSKLIFKNYGGSYQLRIQNAQDLEKIQVLDDAHWAATSIPIDSLNCDCAFASYVDTDKNGRIRTNELRAALVWLFRFLANRSHLSEGTEILNLEDIDISHLQGQKLKASAELILTNLNSLNTQEISLAQVRDVQSIMANMANNGDGIIPPEVTTDFDLSQFITSVMETAGSTLDICGKPGINQEQLEIFFQEAESYLAWQKRGEIPKGDKTTEIMFWGTETPQAYESMVNLEWKLDQYFAQCAMVKFDKRAIVQMQLRQKELEEIDFRDKSIMESQLKDAPLALPNPEGILDLEAMINPEYVECLFEFREKVLKHALGEPVKQFTEKQWNKVKDIFIPYRIWLKSKQGVKVEKLGQERLRTYLKGPYRREASELIAKDLAAADDLNQLHNLEKLILYQRWLMELANNFVSFTNFYSPQHRSLLEMGRLVIDGREMTFTMKVQDRLSHKKIAKNSFIYLLYLEITGRQEKDIKFEIVIAVTSGSTGRLRIGKRGIFFTIDGIEWDAEVVDVVENPISLWESVRAPFKQITNLVKKQIDKFSKSRQDKLETAISSPGGSGIVRDLLLGGGVAIAVLGSAFAYITNVLSQVKLVHILGMLAGVGGIILLPGMIIGFTKICKRDMSVLLEASGWAVNVQMRLNTTLGRLFTHTPCLPKGTSRERRDVAVQFVKKLGYTSFYPKKLFMIVLIITFIILCLILFLGTYSEPKSLFNIFK
ncbi:MAG: hypothetical protein P9L98_02610 [Candidatus Kaelpia imicola]|nr:hypothetical protein [Candidatus Kaelpia imicola]